MTLTAEPNEIYLRRIATELKLDPNELLKEMKSDAVLKEISRTAELAKNFKSAEHQHLFWWPISAWICTFRDAFTGGSIREKNEETKVSFCHPYFFIKLSIISAVSKDIDQQKNAPWHFYP